MSGEDLDAIANRTADVIVERLDLGADLQARFDDLLAIATDYRQQHGRMLRRPCRCLTCTRLLDIIETPGDSPSPDSAQDVCPGGNTGGDSGP